jgi:hypothetical protein
VITNVGMQNVLAVHYLLPQRVFNCVLIGISCMRLQ